MLQFTHYLRWLWFFKVLLHFKCHFTLLYRTKRILEAEKERIERIHEENEYKMSDIENRKRMSNLRREEIIARKEEAVSIKICLLYTSPSPRD